MIRAANLAGAISTKLLYLPGRAPFLRGSLPRCPTACQSQAPSNLPSQPIQTWSSFHSISPASHSKFSNKSLCVVPSRLSKARFPHGITNCLPNGSQSQVCRSWRTVTPAYTLLWTGVTPDLNRPWVNVLRQRPKPLLLNGHLRLGSRDIDDRQVMTSRSQHRLPSLSSRCFFIACAPLSRLSTRTRPKHRALHVPDWLFHGLIRFKSGGKVPFLDLLGALHLMPTSETSHYSTVRLYGTKTTYFRPR